MLSDPFPPPPTQAGARIRPTQHVFPRTEGDPRNLSQIHRKWPFMETHSPLALPNPGLRVLEPDPALLHGAVSRSCGRTGGDNRSGGEGARLAHLGGLRSEETAYPGLSRSAGR